jgi:alpha-1,2-mannosyltransferase
MHGAHRLQERQLHERPLRLTALTERPRLRAAAPWIGVGAALLLVVLAESFEALQLRDVSLDFRSYFFASRALAQGANPYDLQTLQRLARLSRVDGLVYPYLYPPLFAEAIGRLGRLAPIMAQRLWALFGVALLAPALTLFVRAWSSPRGAGAPREVPVPRALAAALAVALLPFGHSASLGQVNLVVLALLLYALAAHEARRDALAGVFVGVAACVKVTPILFLAFFVARRRPVAAIACAATVLVCVGGSIAAFGLAPWREFAARARRRRASTHRTPC